LAYENGTNDEETMENLLAIVADTEASQEWMIAKMDAHQERLFT
jgi:hypothetical protein